MILFGGYQASAAHESPSAARVLTAVEKVLDEWLVRSPRNLKRRLALVTPHSFSTNLVFDFAVDVVATDVWLLEWWCFLPLFVNHQLLQFWSISAVKDEILASASELNLR